MWAAYSPRNEWLDHTGSRSIHPTRWMSARQCHGSKMSAIQNTAIWGTDAGSGACTTCEGQKRHQLHSPSLKAGGDECPKLTPNSEWLSMHLGGSIGCEKKGVRGQDVSHKEVDAGDESA